MNESMYSQASPNMIFHSVIFYSMIFLVGPKKFP